MNDFKQISERLKQLATYIEPGTTFADIGSDHAYLPSYVCIHDASIKAIAGEVSKGPFERAKQTVDGYKLSDRIQVRLGNGLEVIEVGEVDAVVIAGMGGGLIASILEEGAHKLQKVKRIIAQPNTNGYIVRKTLQQLGFIPVQEQIIEENDHIYEIIVAERNDSASLNDRQCMFGPFLEKEKSAVFIKKWTKEREKALYVIEQMNKSTDRDLDKIKRMEENIRWMEEILR